MMRSWPASSKMLGNSHFQALSPESAASPQSRVASSAVSNLLAADAPTSPVRWALPLLWRQPHPSRRTANTVPATAGLVMRQKRSRAAAPTLSTPSPGQAGRPAGGGAALSLHGPGRRIPKRAQIGLCDHCKSKFLARPGKREMTLFRDIGFPHFFFAAGITRCAPLGSFPSCVLTSKGRGHLSA